MREISERARSDAARLFDIYKELLSLGCAEAATGLKEFDEAGALGVTSLGAKIAEVTIECFERWLNVAKLLPEEYLVLRVTSLKQKTRDVISGGRLSAYMKGNMGRGACREIIFQELISDPQTVDYCGGDYSKICFELSEYLMAAADRVLISRS